MSDNIVTLDTSKGQDEPSRDQDRTLINARLQWVARLVSAILNAQSIERPSGMVKRPSVR
jgi:hypothetical protein